MAIESEKIIEVISKEGEAAAKAEELLGLFNEDTKAQLNAVLMHKEQIISEKRDSEAKRKALEEQFNSLKEANEKLSKQLEAASPDEVKKVYDQKLTETANVYEKKIAELTGVLDSYKSKVSEMERVQLNLECMKEFNKALEGKHVDPDAIQNLADFTMGPNCCYFDYRPVGEGKSIIATKNGETIKQAVEAVLTTSFGKRCIVSKSSGGGAEGGASSFDQSQNNPFKTKNLTEQGNLFRENRELFEKLKAQAGR
ncbi:MAG: hypothetical protein KBT03_05840 [Bacteroidales bacterium]|nr:hypothetical protein [Candidatus Scybalousia scybalohippi]